MADRRDPLERAAGPDEDLQGIATWEPRSVIDRLLARYLSPLIRAAVVAVALLLFVLELLLFGFQIVTNPGSAIVVVLFPLSVFPALALVGYVWYNDITTEPVLLMIATFLLGIVLATFPTVVNTVVIAGINEFVPSGPVRTVVEILNFFLIVGPGEEIAKLGAVYAYVYWKDDFDTVVDGAVYGAVAGLGFATIENVSYILQTLAGASSVPELVLSGGVITVVRSIAGPGHVIWTGIAGYYLGLAKFNDEYGLPLAFKGLTLAILLHATYNSLTTVLSGVLNSVSPLLFPVLFGFIVLYHLGGFAFLLIKIRRYRQAYERVSPGPGAAPVDGSR
jgi:RsiW-degrading membrane proteinase PrsW (M82 family)